MLDQLRLRHRSVELSGLRTTIQCCKARAHRVYSRWMLKGGLSWGLLLVVLRLGWTPLSYILLGVSGVLLLQWAFQYNQVNDEIEELTKTVSDIEEVRRSM